MQLIRLDAAIRPRNYQIDLVVDPAAMQFSGRVKIEIGVTTPQRRIILHAANLQFDLVEVWSKGLRQHARVTRLAEDGTMAVEFAQALLPGMAHLVFAYHATLASGLEGIYKVIDAGKPAVFTQFEAIGARKAFPCFDEPGFKSNFDISLRVPKKYQAISNCGEISARREGEDVIHQFATTKPLPTYLIAMAVGQFDVVIAKPIPPSRLRKHEIPLRGIAMRGKGESLKIALADTARLLPLQEKYFRIAYPFDKLDIVAVPDFGAGGMENAGAIFYDEGYVLLDARASIADRRYFLSIHAHELAHQWFGNYATPAWWDDLWLNESFASFMEVKFAGALEPDWQFDTDLMVSAHDAMELDQCKSVRRVREAVTSVDGISAAFDDITYQKGAVLLAMAEQQMGVGPFQKFVQLFLQRHAFATMSTNSFLGLMQNQPNGKAPAKMLREMISLPGLPVVAASRNATARVSGKPHYAAHERTIPQWQGLLARFARLPRAAALNVAIDIDLELLRGRINFSQFRDAMKIISRHPDWAVAGFPLARLEFFARRWNSYPNLTNAARNCLRDVYGPQLKTMNWRQRKFGDDIATWQTTQQREDLVDAFAAAQADNEVQQRLSKLGAALALNPKENFDASRMTAPDMVGAALVAAAKAGGDAFLKRAARRFKPCKDLSARGLWLDAIAASPAAASAAMVEQLLLSAELRNQEVPDLLFARAAWPEFHDGLWDIITRNARGLLARLDGDLDVTLIQVADDFASQALALKVEATIKPLLGELRGGAVQLNQTLERIRLNAALLDRLERGLA